MKSILVLDEVFEKVQRHCDEHQLNFSDWVERILVGSVADSPRPNHRPPRLPRQENYDDALSED